MYEYLRSLATIKSGQTTFVSYRIICRIIANLKIYVTDKIAYEIRNNCDGMFSISIDGATDNSSTSQYSLVVRFVTKSLQIFNRLFVFTSPMGQSGREIFDMVKKKLNDLRLNIQICIASCTDGATNLTSEDTGLAAFLHGISPSHISIWCVCHRFNLVMQDTIGKSNSTQNIWTHVNSLATFFRGSPKRMTIWKNILKLLKEIYKDIDTRMRPSMIGKTRWWSMQKVIHNIVKSPSCFVAVYIGIVNSLSDKKLPRSKKEMLQRSTAFWYESKNLLKLYVLNEILSKLLQVLKSLEKSTLTIVDMKKIVDCCYQKLKVTNISLTVSEGQTFIASVHDRIRSDKIQAILDTKGIKLTELDDRDVASVKNWAGEILDSVVSEFETRFMCDFEENAEFYTEIMRFNPISVMEMDNYDDFSLPMLSQFNGFEEKEVIIEMKDFSVHLKSFWNNNIDLQTDHSGWTLLSNFFSVEANQIKYQKLNVIYRYILTIPSSQVECERSFSVLKNVKTAKMSTLTVDNLECLMITKMNADLVPKTAVPYILNMVANSSEKLKSKLISKA